MKERGFDNFLQRPSEKVKVSRKTHATTHSLYLEVSIRRQRSFWEGTLRHIWFFFYSTSLSSSTEQDVSFVLETTPRQEARALDEDKLVSFFKKSIFLRCHGFSAPTQFHNSPQQYIFRAPWGWRCWCCWWTEKKQFKPIKYSITQFKAWPSQSFPSFTSCAVSVMIIKRESGQF